MALTWRLLALHCFVAAVSSAEECSQGQGQCTADAAEGDAFLQRGQRKNMLAQQGPAGLEGSSQRRGPSPLEGGEAQGELEEFSRTHGPGAGEGDIGGLEEFSRTHGPPEDEGAPESEEAASKGGSATAAEEEARAAAVAGTTTDARAASRPRPLPDEFSHSNGTSLYANASAPRTAVAVGGGAVAHPAPGHVFTAAAQPNPMPCDEIEIMTLAHMSRQVYDLADSPGVGMNDVIHEAGFVANETYQSFDIGWVGDHTGLWVPSYAVYVRESPCRQAVVAIKGTSLTRNDIRADAYSIVGGMHPSLAQQILAAVVQRWIGNGYTVFSTGHSLGGYLGEIVSTTHNLPGAVFCAPGPNSVTSSHNGPFQHGKFHNLNHEWDFLGNVAPGHFQHAQWTIYVKTDNGYHHGIEEMIEAIRTKGDWESMTNGNVASYASSAWYGYVL